MRFGDDRTKAAAAKMAAHLRNETKGARAIAAFGYLDERVMRRRSQHAGRRVVVKISRALVTKWDNGKRSRIGIRIANGEDVVDLARSDIRIDLRHLGFQFVAITLNQTDGDT